MTEGIGGSKIFSDGWGSNNQKKSCIFHSPQLQFLKAISYHPPTPSLTNWSVFFLTFVFLIVILILRFTNAR